MQYSKSSSCPLKYSPFPELKIDSKPLKCTPMQLTLGVNKRSIVLCRARRGNLAVGDIPVKVFLSKDYFFDVTNTSNMIFFKA